MLLKGFAAFALSERSKGPGVEVTRAATRAVVDWFSATLAGAQTRPSRALTRALVEDDVTGPARLVGSGRAVPVRTAALINATASHVVEFDDIYREGTYHPGSPTVGAALAVTEKVGGSGADFLRAVTVGYEIGDRVAAAMAPTHYDFWHPTGTVGTLGAAAAAAEALRLDEDRFAHALATATTMAAGLQQAFRSEGMSKPLHAGHAAEAGVLAALAAAEGFTGALDVVDGPVGFGAAMSRSASWNTALDGLGSRYLIAEATVKNHACCGHTFAAVDAAVQIHGSVDPDSIESVRVETYAVALDVAGIAEPRTAFEAKFSLAFCVATALVHGSVRLQAFDEDRLADPRVRRLTSATTLVADDELSAVFPGQRAARVIVTLTDGRTITVYRPTRKGDPDDPLTDEELDGKFVELATPVLGDAATAALGTALWNVASLPLLRDLPIGPGGSR